MTEIDQKLLNDVASDREERRKLLVGRMVELIEVTRGFDEADCQFFAGSLRTAGSYTEAISAYLRDALEMAREEAALDYMKIAADAARLAFGGWDPPRKIVALAKKAVRYPDDNELGKCDGYDNDQMLRFVLAARHYGKLAKQAYREKEEGE